MAPGTVAVNWRSSQSIECMQEQTFHLRWRRGQAGSFCKHCLRALAQESSGPPTRPYVPPLRPHFPTSSSKGMNVHIMVTVVLSIPNSQRPCAFCVSYPSPHTVHMSPFLSVHVSPGISTVWVQPLLPTMRLLPAQVRVLCDMPGAQMFHVDVSMEQFLPTALQRETKVAALPAVCFLPMSTGELCSVPGRPSVLWLSEKSQSTPSQESSYVPILVKAVLSSCLQGANRNSLPRQAASNTSLGVWCLTPSPKQADSLRRHLLRYQFPPSDHCVL